MTPVPRTLSTDCGTCVRYTAEAPLTELMHADYDAIYRIEENNYCILQKNSD